VLHISDLHKFHHKIYYHTLLINKHNDSVHLIAIMQFHQNTRRADWHTHKYYDKHNGTLREKGNKGKKKIQAQNGRGQHVNTI